MDTRKPQKATLQNSRVIQRNLVYVIGLSPRVADELKLCTDSYFGQYGEIKKFVVNKNNAYFDSVHGPSYSAYITFATETQASTCIHATNNHSLDGRRIKATFGTTKYCSYFLRNVVCPNPDCLYLHEIGHTKDTFNREEVLQSRHIQPQDTLHDTLVVKRSWSEQDGPKACPQVEVQQMEDEEDFEEYDGPRTESRYSFAVEDTEFTQEQTEPPDHIQYIVEQITEQGQGDMDIPAHHVANMLSKDSPDKWMTDVISVVRKDQDEISSATTRDMFVMSAAEDTD